MRQGLFQTSAAHPRQMHTPVASRLVAEIAHARSLVANDVTTAPKKTVHFATTEFKVIPDTNLDSRAVLTSQTQAAFPDSPVASRFTTGAPNPKAFSPSQSAQNPPRVITDCCRVKEEPYVLEIRKLH